MQGDQYVAQAIQEELLNLGVIYREVTFGRHTRPQIFNNLKHIIQEGRIELLDHPELLRQLRSLEEHRSSDGNLDVRPDHGQKDDLAIVVAMSALELSQSACDSGPGPIICGHVERPWGGLVSNVGRGFDGYPVVQTCAKFPNCWDANDCECCGFAKT